MLLEKDNLTRQFLNRSPAQTLYMLQSSDECTLPTAIRHSNNEFCQIFQPKLLFRAAILTAQQLIFNTI